MAAGGHRGGLVLSVSLSSKQRASKPASSNFPEGKRALILSKARQKCKKNLKNPRTTCHSVAKRWQKSVEFGGNMVAAGTI
jgi:hypothetical protein